jgi:hypothetical protein
MQQSICNLLFYRVPTLLSMQQPYNHSGDLRIAHKEQHTASPGQQPVMWRMLHNQQLRWQRHLAQDGLQLRPASNKHSTPLSQLHHLQQA